MWSGKIFNSCRNSFRDKNGNVIGAVSLGYVLSNQNFIDKQKQLVGSDIEIFYADERIATTIEKNEKRAEGTKLENKEIIDLVLNKGQDFYEKATILGMDYFAGYFPIISVNGEIKGILFLGKNMASVDSLISKNLNYLGLLIIGVFIVLFIVLNVSIRKIIILPLKGIKEKLIEGSEQIITASNEVAVASNKLAESSSEQVASVEETSATLEEASSMIRENAENSKQAALLAGETKDFGEHCNIEMQDMSMAMTDIKKSSDEISKIIKVIDAIAFQINVLALNAAVEAAKAGDAGLGFAVVAEDVRNLAQRSSLAAKGTAQMIEANI